MQKSIPLAVVAALALAPAASSQQVRVRVVAENLSPEQGTHVSPVWVAFHDGTFDVYDDTVVASAALESMAEDGNANGLAAAFVGAAVGQANNSLGTSDLAPGETAGADFLIDPTTTTGRFATVVAAVVPSNDAFVGNADPIAFPIFDLTGTFIASNVFFSGSDVRDAGTEANDELAANTNGLSQTVDDTGTDEVQTVGLHAGYNAAGTGGVLDEASFAQADFTETGYPVLKVRFASADAITEAREHTVALSGDEEVPPVGTKVKGNGTFDLVIGGQSIVYEVTFNKKKKLKNVTGAHLHLGATGENGPIVVSLFAPESPQKKVKKLEGTITSNDLVGPLAGMPLDALVAEIEAGNVYMNVHTEKNPSGEVRGQLELTVP